MLNVSHATGFDWDKGNRDKNLIKHGVANSEAEELFFNEPLTLLPDPAHSQTEPRFHALGKTNNGRLLFISFTIRGARIRVISARDMNNKEIKHSKKYEETA